MKRVDQSDLIVGFQTHPGETGKNNEDNLTVVAYEDPGRNRSITTLAVVADGIGGNMAGEVASQIAVNTLAEHVARADRIDPQALFTNGFSAVSQQIAAHVAKHPNISNLGTTAVAVLVHERRLYTASIGDSRIYLLRGEQFRQLTTDHTVIQEAIERGILTPEEAKGNKLYQHVIRRYLGATSDPTPDFRLRLSAADTDAQLLANQGFELQPGDQVLLCSDGLHDLVENEEIGVILKKHTQPQPAVDELVLLARQRGGHDNITIIVLAVPRARRRDQPRFRLGVAAFLFAVLGGLGVIALLAAGWYFFFGPGGENGGTPDENLPVPELTAPAEPEATKPPAELEAPTATFVPPTEPVATEAPAEEAPAEQPGDGEQPGTKPTQSLDPTPRPTFTPDPNATPLEEPTPEPTAGGG